MHEVFMLLHIINYLLFKCSPFVLAFFCMDTGLTFYALIKVINKLKILTIYFLNFQIGCISSSFGHVLNYRWFFTYDLLSSVYPLLPTFFSFLSNNYVDGVIIKELFIQMDCEFVGLNVKALEI